jgi:hypothetical protein
MVYSGCKRKFDVAAFVRKYKKAGANAARGERVQDYSYYQHVAHP